MVLSYLLNMKKIFIISSAIVLTALAVFFVFRGCFFEPVKEEPPITVYRSKTGKLETMSLEKYIVGTVAAEMPASFELEALKAQAVCARTYALRKLSEGKVYPREANLSDDINTCQAYVNQSEFINLHPGQAELWWDKIQQAVKETRGEVILYDNQLIDALYHSTCGGQTESAFEVWGQNIPYLQSVTCRYCQESRRYKTVQVFSWQEVSANTGKGHSIKVMETSSSGRIKRVKVNQKIMSGSQLRQLFRLPSTWCSFHTDNNELTITSHGYGHGVGLCQYGAQGMAKQGNDYQTILKHYYRQTRVYKLPY